MNCTQAGRASTATRKHSGLDGHQGEAPSRGRSKREVALSSKTNVQVLPRTQLQVPDAGPGSDVADAISSARPASRSRRDHVHVSVAEQPAEELPGQPSTAGTAEGKARDLNLDLPQTLESQLLQAPSPAGREETTQSPLQWARSVAQSRPPVSVTQKAIYDEERNPAPFCLYWLDDLYRLNRFIRSCVVEYMTMNAPSRHADIQQWHEWFHMADTDASLSEETRRKLVRNSFALMYQNGSSPDVIQQATVYVRTCAQDLAVLSSRHGNVGWSSYDHLVKSIRQSDSDQRSVFLRCVTLHMIQNREMEYAVRPDENGNPTEMIRPAYKQSIGFEQSLVLRDLVIKGLSAAVVLSPEYIQALRDLGSAHRQPALRAHEKTYLDGLERLAIDAETLSERQVHKISNDLTRAFLARVPRKERNEEKEWLREKVAFETLYSGNPGNWFDIRVLCNDLYHTIRTYNVDPVFTMAILKRELAKGTIQAQTGVFFTADSQALTVCLRSYKHRHAGESACTLL